MTQLPILEQQRAHYAGARIMELWDQGNDTLDIARVLNVPEAQVYGFMAARSKPIGRRRERYATYYDNRFARKDVRS